MTDEFSLLPAMRRPSRERPLAGLTVLLVEDSRFASEAIRLMCLRSGARLRRADSLAAARRHLQSYRPSVVIVDMGLPDGSGAELIGDLALALPRLPVLLATSGDPATRALAEAHGADGFLAKPVASLGVFQQAILCHLPAEACPAGPRPVPTEAITPDLLALRDDLSEAAAIMAVPVDRARLGYLAQFLCSVAHAAADTRLEEAAAALGRSGPGEGQERALGRVAGMVERRLTGVAMI